MNEQVIRAAAEAWVATSYGELTNPESWMTQAEAAITAADAARAPAIRDAFEAYELAVATKHLCDLKGRTETADYWRQEVKRTRRDLLKACGIEDQS